MLSSKQLISFIRSAVVLASLVLTACGPKYPNCGEDSDCHEHEFCVDQQCQQCRSESDCGQGQQCNAGRCDAIPGYCADNSTCPSGQECQNNRCTRVTQSTTDTTDPTTTTTPTPQACQISPIYFDFESADLSGSARDQIQAVVNCMRERNVARLTVVGHCDPRGTEEYNLALGDRRARAVRDFMVSLGVARNALNSTSQGEEMAQGSEETTWARDRKVEFVQR